MEVVQIIIELNCRTLVTLCRQNILFIFPKNLYVFLLFVKANLQWRHLVMQVCCMVISIFRFACHMRTVAKSLPIAHTHFIIVAIILK